MPLPLLPIAIAGVAGGALGGAFGLRNLLGGNKSDMGKAAGAAASQFGRPPMPPSPPATPASATPNWLGAPPPPPQNTQQGRPLTVPGAPTYPVGPAPISTDQIMRWDEMLLDDTEKVARARADTEAGRQAADVARANAMRDVIRRSGAELNQGRAQAGSAGLALSPATMGRIARSIRDARAAQFAEVERGRSDTLRQLLQGVALANENYERTKQAIARQRSLLGADRSALMPGVNY